MSEESQSSHFRRAAKWTLAVAFLLVGLVLVFQEEIVPNSQFAVVASPEVDLQAPVGGCNLNVKPGVGSIVEAGEEIFRAEPSLGDFIYSGLMAEARELQAKAVGTEEELSALRNVGERSSEVANIGKRHHAEHLAKEQKSLVEEIATLKGEVETLERQMNQDVELIALKAISAEDKLQLEMLKAQRARELVTAERELAQVRNQSAALQAGAPLAMGAGEVSGNQLAFLRTNEVKVEGLVAQQRADRAVLSAVEETLERFKNWVGLAPSRGLVWQTASGNGGCVRHGETVARLLPCKTDWVVAAVSPKTFRTLTRGQKITFELTDSGAKHPGEVAMLVGQPTIENTGGIVAPGLMPGSTRDIQLVLIRVPNLAKMDCPVGLSGTVRFAGLLPL